MLSLAKLAAFAAADSDLTLQLETINAELSIVDYQEQLGAVLLQAFGYDVENQKVLRIEEIINVSILYLYPNVNSNTNIIRRFRMNHFKNALYHRLKTVLLVCVVVKLLQV